MSVAPMDKPSSPKAPVPTGKFTKFAPSGVTYCPKCRRSLVGKSSAGKCSKCELAYDDATFVIDNHDFAARYWKWFLLVNFIGAIGYFSYFALTTEDPFTQNPSLLFGVFFVFGLIRVAWAWNDKPLIATLPDGIALSSNRHMKTMVPWSELLEIIPRPTRSNGLLLYFRRRTNEIVRSHRHLGFQLRTGQEEDALLAAVYQRTQRTRSKNAPPFWHCPRCEYDLRGQKALGSCPECGIAFDDMTHLWPIDRARMNTIWVTSAAILLYVGITGTAFAFLGLTKLRFILSGSILVYSIIGIVLFPVLLVAGLYCGYRAWPRRYLLTNRDGMLIKHPRRELHFVAWNQLEYVSFGDDALMLTEGDRSHRLKYFVASRIEARELRDAIAKAMRDGSEDRGRA